MIKFPPNLLRGYGEFRNGHFAREQERYESLATKGQKPTTLVIACCDSRAAPETIFNALPGEIFVVRNVANLVPPYTPNDKETHHSTLAGLEYAVQSLKVTNILILGHAKCGGIAAALEPNIEPLTVENYVGRWIETLKPIAQQVNEHHHECQECGREKTNRHTHLERLSICKSVENLRSYSFVSKLEKEGHLNVHGAWFDIATGELWLLDERKPLDPNTQTASEGFTLVE